MKSTNSKIPQSHLLICCKTKEGKPSCGAKGSQKLVDSIKNWIKANALKGRLRCSSTSCLGHCEEGITACLYPQNQWFTQITLEDEDSLKKILQDSLPF